MTFRAGALVACMSGLAMVLHAGAAEPPVDANLLEFLGSVDTEDKDWHDYLARTDIDKVAKRSHAPPPAAPTAPPGAAAKPPDNSPPPPAGSHS